MRPEHETQKPENEMTHAEYVKSDLHEGRIRDAAAWFEGIESRCQMIRRYIEAGHLDDAEHFAEYLEHDLRTAMINLYQASDAVDRARDRSIEVARRTVVE